MGPGWIVGVLGVFWETLGGHMHNITIISRPLDAFRGKNGPYMALIWLYRDFDQVLGVWGVWGGSGVGLGWIVGVLGVF